MPSSLGEHFDQWFAAEPPVDGAEESEGVQDRPAQAPMLERGPDQGSRVATAGREESLVPEQGWVDCECDAEESGQVERPARRAPDHRAEEVDQRPRLVPRQWPVEFPQEDRPRRTARRAARRKIRTLAPRSSSGR